MNRLILIYPDQGEALNQFFLVIKKAKEEEKGNICSIPSLPISPSPPLPLFLNSGYTTQNNHAITDCLGRSHQLMLALLKAS